MRANFGRTLRLKIEGETSHKRYRVMRDVVGAGTLASFDTLQEARAHVATLRRDWHYVIREYGRKIVWPEKKRTP